MSKRKKQPTAPAIQRTAGQAGSGTPRDSASATGQCHPPKKQPVLLAVSAILFAVWFVYLVATALRLAD